MLSSGNFAKHDTKVSIKHYGVMAKLHERPVIEEIDEASDPTRFDSDLAKVLIAHDNDPEEFLSTVLGFVDRKTRFFKQSDASRKLAKLAEGASPATSSGKSSVKGGFFGKPSEHVNAATKVLFQVFYARGFFMLFDFQTMQCCI